MRGPYAVSAGLSVDVLRVDAVGASAVALGAAGPIVTVATATAQANRIQCCIAAIRWSLEKRERNQGLSRSEGAPWMLLQNVAQTNRAQLLYWRSSLAFWMVKKKAMRAMATDAAEM